MTAASVSPVSSVPADPPAERPGPRPSAVVRWLAAGIWLFYLEGAVAEVVRAGPGWRQALGIAALVVFVAAYLTALNRAGAFRNAPRDRRDVLIRWALLVVMVLGVLALVPAASDEALTGVVFISAAGMGSLPAKQGWILMLTLFAATEAAARLMPGWSGTNYGFAVILAGLAVWGLRTAFNPATPARRRRTRAARAGDRGGAVADRPRPARHPRPLADGDLGQDRARRADAGHRPRPGTYRAARTVRPDARRAVRRSLDRPRRPGRVAGGRDRRGSGGIGGGRHRGGAAHCRRRGALTPARTVAWAVREGVTNVVRHSGAATCWVTMTPTSLSVVDDGTGPDAAGSAGQGLEGLRQRCRLAGATLAVGPGPGGVGFSIRVEVPA